MFVVKRNGSREEVKFDKVTDRVKKLCFGLNMTYVNPTVVAQHVSTGMVNDIPTSKLDILASRVAADLSTKHPDYNILAGRIMVSNLQKEIKVTFSEAMDQLYNYTNPSTKKHAPVISKELWEIVMNNADRLNNIIVDERDFDYDIFGIETLRRSYLLRAGDKILETPQYMHLRVALGIHGDDIDGAEKMYELLSKRLYTHSTPTIFNSGTPRPQMASCFLLSTEDDSIEGIFNTVKECALISKFAGGIGVSIHNIRSSGSYIEGTNGISNGIVPFLKIFNETARAVNQAGRRKGSFAVYLEPHHADIFQFIDLRRPGGVEEFRTRDLFIALWVSDLFMERVSNGGPWTLFNPDASPGLEDVWGNEYRRLYEQYEREGRGVKVIKARELWTEICKAQIETGTPYILNKDQCNLKSNQQNLGTIRSSNLCVAPETKILTDTGYHPIATLVDQEVNVWNGEEWSTTTVRQTGTNQKLIKVKMSNGSIVECTPYHKFYIETGTRPVEAKDLKPGMKLIKHELPVVDDPTAPEFPHAYTHGLFCSDTNNVTLFDDMADKFEVPINYSVSSKLEWFAGVCDGDGTVARNGTTESIQVCSIHKEYLIDIVYMLQTIGVYSKVTKSRDELMNEMWRLLINSVDTQKLLEMGFSPKRLKINNRSPQRDARHFTKIISIEDEGRYDDTYCFTEQKRGMGMFGGVLTGQCSEIIEYTSPSEHAVCNLAQINISNFVDLVESTMDYEGLVEISKQAIKNLNLVIDKSFYPVEKARLSNLKHRPLGLGVSGLHDVFFKLRLASFDCPEARLINKRIFESIYRGAVLASIELARAHGPYESFPGSPASRGILQFDMWGLKESDLYWKDWTDIKNEVVKHGMRNSLLIALMPTASSATIMGVTECFEIQTSNLYSRKVLSGEFTLINKYLINELIEVGLWNEDIMMNILGNDGSIQHIDAIPQEIRTRYKTVWEYSMKSVIDMSADRSPFVDQSQSLNLFLRNPTVPKLTSMHLYSWNRGLKTMSYYLRSRAATEAIKFTVDKKLITEKTPTRAPEDSEEEVCLSCQA